jgi:N-acetylmuramoyl-L-alanine amidase
MAHVDRERWAELVRRPDWYLALGDEYEALLACARKSPPDRARAIADDVYSFFERALATGAIALGSSGPAWDAERRPVDTAVIHHTNLPPRIRVERIEAIHLMRLYARYYADPTPSEAAIRGQPLYSGHVRDGRQVFFAYHWLVREDGARERLLEDHETGWHAGDWPTNCRSVAVCFDGRFEDCAPPRAMIESAGDLLLTEYPQVAPEQVRGHREINPRTTCPGATFLTGWKRSLLDELARR